MLVSLAEATERYKCSPEIPTHTTLLLVFPPSLPPPISPLEAVSEGPACHHCYNEGKHPPPQGMSEGSPNSNAGGNTSLAPKLMVLARDAVS